MSQVGAVNARTTRARRNKLPRSTVKGTVVLGSNENRQQRRSLIQFPLPKQLPGYKLRRIFSLDSAVYTTRD